MNWIHENVQIQLALRSNRTAQVGERGSAIIDILLAVRSDTIARDLQDEIQARLGEHATNTDGLADGLIDLEKLHAFQQVVQVDLVPSEVFQATLDRKSVM